MLITPSARGAGWALDFPGRVAGADQHASILEILFCYLSWILFILPCILNLMQKMSNDFLSLNHSPFPKTDFKGGKNKETLGLIGFSNIFEKISLQ